MKRKREREREDFIYVSKGMFKLIISNIGVYFQWTYIFLTFRVQHFPVNSIKDWKPDWKLEKAEEFPIYMFSHNIGT